MKFLITITLSFVLVLALGTSSNAQYKRPCEPTQNWNGYENFQRNHILPPFVNPHNMIELKRHIENIRRCHIPEQSFIPYKYRAAVERICNGGGKNLVGKYPGNLCISDKQILVYHVLVKQPGCEIQPKRHGYENVIVACDKVSSGCLPVHFEKNKDLRSYSIGGVCKP